VQGCVQLKRRPSGHSFLSPGLLCRPF